MAGRMLSVEALVVKLVAGLLCMGFLVVLPGCAIYSTCSFPEEAWQSIGRLRSRWTIAFWLLPFLIGPVAAAIYFVCIRRALVPLGRIDRIRHETPAQIAGAEQGRVGVASPGRWPLRMVLSLLNWVWFTFETGERVGVAPEWIRPLATPDQPAGTGR